MLYFESRIQSLSGLERKNERKRWCLPKVNLEIASLERAYKNEAGADIQAQRSLTPEGSTEFANVDSTYCGRWESLAQILGLLFLIMPAQITRNMIKEASRIAWRNEKR